MHNKHASYIPPSESALQFRAPLPRIADTHFADSYVRQIDMSTEKAARLVHRAGGLDNSMISQDVVSAAERHKNAAPGASPGYRYQHAASPEGAKDSGSTLSPLPGLGSTPTRTPGSRPGLCPYAAPRQKKQTHVSMRTNPSQRNVCFCDGRRSTRANHGVKCPNSRAAERQRPLYIPNTE